MACSARVTGAPDLAPCALFRGGNRVKRDARLVVLSGLCLTALLAASACSRTSSPPADAAAAPGGAPATPAAAGAAAEPAPGPSPTPAASPTRAVPSVSSADRAAGIVSRRVANDLGGRLVTVPGGVKAPGEGHVVRIKVQVEKGLPVDGEAFAGFV